jgi:hypothetical protein
MANVVLQAAIGLHNVFNSPSVGLLGPTGDICTPFFGRPAFHSVLLVSWPSDRSRSL